ncbi:VWA domain-containing protein [Marinobacter sp. ELB17]|uniref:VWA domain-containing protein n=1 Tax=Marinobacter sp. ELB17 TaxID=270374 RepID=UPI0012F52308|nr:vWA domain-containing protein [Marinobacter sp. ELB17]
MKSTLVTHKTLWLALVITLVAAFSGMAQAQAEQADSPQLPGAVDVRIIVDISGSMKQNDPQNLRRPAVRLLARLLPDGATAGVWTFGQYVNMLVPHREVSDAWRDMAIEQSDAINSVAMRTNLGAAIETASDGYFTGGVLSNTHFIVLTDGKVDISRNPSANKAEANRILDTLVPPLKQQGARFHAVALSAEADTEFLRKLASDSNGSFHVAENANDLSRAFLDAFNAAVPQEQTPIDDDGFMVDASVTEYTALIFWGDNETSANRALALKAPGAAATTLQQHPDNIRWAREPGYDLITVTDPVAGRWSLDGQLGEGSRVSVVSDLRMIVSPIPGIFSIEKPLAIRVGLFDGDEPITNADFLSVLSVDLTLANEDGRSGTKVLSEQSPPADGVYRYNIAEMPTAGQYQVVVEARSSTFARKFSGTTRFEPAAGAEASAAEAPIFAPETGAANPFKTATPAEPKPQPDTAPMVDEAPEPEPASEPAAEVEPVAELEPAPEPEAAAQPIQPIDVTELDKPEPAEPESANSAIAPWMMAAGAGALLVLALLIWLLLRKRKNTDEIDAETDAETDVEAEAAAPVPAPEVAAVPVITDIDEPENVPKLSPGDLVEPKLESGLEPVPELQPEPEPEKVPELKPEPAVEPVVEEAPVPTIEPEPYVTAQDLPQPREPEPLPEETIPLIKPEEGDPEPLSFDDDFELSVPDDELDKVLEEPEEPADEEFGLDDYDLSEFDDLPSTETDKSADKGTGPKPKNTPDNDRKK